MAPVLVPVLGSSSAYEDFPGGTDCLELAIAKEWAACGNPSGPSQEALNLLPLQSLMAKQSEPLGK